MADIVKIAPGDNLRITSLPDGTSVPKAVQGKFIATGVDKEGGMPLIYLFDGKSVLSRHYVGIIEKQ